jgi:hypothetical protein
MPVSLPPQCRLALKALAASVVVNGVMMVMSVLGGSRGSGSLALRISDTIAAPPGAIAQRIFAPKEHSVGAFVAAATESLVLSIVFYLIVAWVILEAVSVYQRVAREGQ